MRDRYRIKITIETPTIVINNDFDLKDYDSPEEWVKAAKDWIKKEK
jgi:hypothetical protein